MVQGLAVPSLSCFGLLSRRVPGGEGRRPVHRLRLDELLGRHRDVSALRDERRLHRRPRLAGHVP